MGLFSGFSGPSARKKRHHGNGSGYYKQQSGMGGLFGGIMGSFGSGSSARRHRGGFGFGSLSSSKRRHAGYGTPYPAQQAPAQAAPQTASANSGSTCPNCHAAVPAGAKFCLECGTKLGGGFCAQCGATLPPTGKFCPECGAPRG